MVLLLKGSGVDKGSMFVVFLKKPSDEALNGSVSLNGAPPKGSVAADGCFVKWSPWKRSVLKRS